MLQDAVVEELEHHLELDKADVEHLIEVPPNPEMGDFAFPCFSLSEAWKQSPQEIAEQLLEQIDNSSFEDVDVEGPYINFSLRKEDIFEAAFAENIPENEGTVVIDYSSPNIGKPFHIGHLRSTVIGSSLKKIYEYTGYGVIGINHLGDWGTQFGKLIAAYKKWDSFSQGLEDLKEGKQVEIDGYGEVEDSVELMYHFYVKFHDLIEEDETFAERGKEEFKKLERGDEQNRKIWTMFKELSLEKFEELYTRLAVDFDSYCGESFYQDKMDDVIEDLENEDILVENEGAKIVEFEDMSPAIIVKNDGATTYMTRDLAALKYRKETYDFDKILYEVGNDQKLHFKQLFTIGKKIGYLDDEAVHVNHGMYRFETSSMSTRKGQTVFMEDVLNQAVGKVKEVIQEKNPDLEKKDDVAESVGVGSILFFDLKNDRVKDIVFDWDDIIDFEGDTGPYLQYTYARLQSIIDKSTCEPGEYSMLKTFEEKQLGKELAMFGTKIQDAIDKNKPHVIARYLLNLGRKINAYYAETRIIQEDKSIERSRLTLISEVKDTMEKGLELLGLETIREM